MAETKLKNQGIDSTVNTLKSKVGGYTRDMTAASGDVAYTGIGFQPTAIQVFYGIESNNYSGVGFCDQDRAVRSMRVDAGNNYAFNNNFITISSGTGAYQEATVKSFDSDGFTLTWTKTGSPTGTCTIRVLCFR